MTFRVVQLHGGTIDFTSKQNEGTVFRLRFPPDKDERRNPSVPAGQAVARESGM